MLNILDSHIVSNKEKQNIRKALQNVAYIVPIKKYNQLRDFEAPDYILLDGRSYLELVRVDNPHNNNREHIDYGYRFCSTGDVIFCPAHSKPGLTGADR